MTLGPCTDSPRGTKHHPLIKRPPVATKRPLATRHRPTPLRRSISHLIRALMVRPRNTRHHKWAIKLHPVLTPHPPLLTRHMVPHRPQLINHLRRRQCIKAIRHLQHPITYLRIKRPLATPIPNLALPQPIKCLLQSIRHLLEPKPTQLAIRRSRINRLPQFMPLLRHRLK